VVFVADVEGPSRAVGSDGVQSGEPPFQPLDDCPNCGVLRPDEDCVNDLMQPVPWRHVDRAPRLPEPYLDVPTDVCDWLDETYTPDGVGIWLLAWTKADKAERNRMVLRARIDPMGG
jgi:hypothetical protein